MPDLVRNPSTQSAFTLLELLVVLSISTLMLLLVAPRFDAVLPGLELRRSSTQLASTLRLARSKAIESQSTVTVEIDSRNNTYKVSGSKLVGHLSTATTILNSGEKNSRPKDSKIYVSFYPNGTASNTELLLKLNKSAYSINVEWLSGAVTIDSTT